MTKEEAYNLVYRIITDRLGVDDRISPETRFVDDLGCDSLDLVEIGLDLEQELGIELPDDQLEGMVTIQDAVDLLMEKMSRKSGR